jgi:hypothetical protein
MEPPVELFGEEHDLPSISSVHLNMLSVIAQKLLDNTVVGDNLENFAFNSVVQTSSNAETEMQVGESNRRVPFLTNSSKFRNDILKNNIYHHFDLQVITSIGSTTDNDEDYDGEYEDGLEINQVLLLEHI